jgi:hypothetical protein
MATTNPLTGFYALNKIGVKTFETNFSILYKGIGYRRSIIRKKTPLPSQVTLWGGYIFFKGGFQLVSCTI